MPKIYAHDTEQLIRQCRKLSGNPPDETLIHELQQALSNRNSPDLQHFSQNTYLRDLPIPQIELFDILANRFPLVLQAQELVTQAILHVSKGCTNINILDIGIGRGVQISGILHALSDRGGIEKVQVTGIEIMPQALAHSTGLLEQMRPELSFELSFSPVHIDAARMDTTLIRDTLMGLEACTVINASLTLHHIQSTDLREALFRKLGALQPALLTLIEPNTDCQTNDHRKRTLHAFEHFHALYAYIDTLQESMDAKKALKQFFSNEFFDCVALPDASRYEQYAPAKAWQKWAAGAALRPIDLAQICPEPSIPGIQCGFEPEGYVNFRSGSTDLLAILAFKS